MSWHSKIPWETIRVLYRQLRARFFTTPRPTGRYFVVTESIERIEEVLGSRHYAPNWELSYNYRGEVLNLARIEWHYDDAYPDLLWWQVHVRGWEHDDGTLWLKAHWETEPTETDKDHLNGTGYSGGAGMAALADTLTKAGIEFEERTYDA